MGSHPADGGAHGGNEGAVERAWIYDTTLRDGTQGENIAFSAEEKLDIALRLDEIGIPYIEGGWPGSNPRDLRFFQLARHAPLQQATICAFGATRRAGCRVDQDAQVRALLESQTAAVAVFGKSWDLHVTQILEVPPEENLAMIRDTVGFLKAEGREVIYDAEHFFDGFAENPGYALQSLSAAAAGGADWLVLCDTNGGRLPFEIAAAVLAARQALTAGGWPAARLGIHSHNDCGLAVANSLEAVRAGVCMVHGTVNGYGERCGNADLTTLLPLLTLKMGIPCLAADQIARLRKLSRFVSETANMIPLASRPFVGESAFAHKGGIHVSAILKQPRAYEHIRPETVGNRRRVLMSDLAGRSNVEFKARELGVELNDGGLDSRRIVSEIKRLEQEGYQFDTADGSFRILLEKFTRQFHPLFELKSFRVSVEKDEDRPCSAHATIKIGVGGREEITAAEGDGPVSALDNALRKALGQFYPDLESMRLVDFKVRVIDGRAGTAARVRVFIESRDHDDIWRTIGVSEDIIEASWQALADSFQYKLAKHRNGVQESHRPAAPPSQSGFAGRDLELGV
jgi:2-isopropylmalate synthase